MLRKERGLSQKAVADTIVITRTAYNKYESGVIQPVRKLKELSDLFHVSADYILGRNGHNPLLDKLEIEAQIRKYLDLSEGGRNIVDITLDAVHKKEREEHMDELMSLMQRRRSIRKFTSEPISKEDLEAVVQAGLLAPSGRSLCPVEFIAVQDRILLDKLAHARVGAAKMLEGAAAAIVVIADKDKSDTIIEDSSIAMMNMLLMATELGLGSCWIQGRMREAENKEQTTEAYVRDVLGFPENYQLEAMVALGHPAQERPAYDLKDLHYEKVHPDTF